MVVLLSDCFDDADRLGRALRRLRYHRHEVMLFHVLAPEELEFPFGDATKFRDLERPGRDVLFDARRLREEYLRNFAAYRESLKTTAEDLHVDYHLLRTDEPIDRALGAYLARRALRS